MTAEKQRSSREDETAAVGEAAADFVSGGGEMNARSDRRREMEPRVGGDGDASSGAGKWRRAVRVGIVGPLCGGKSTVLKMFGELGAYVTSADEVNRDLLRPGSEVLRRVIDEFGEQFLRPDGTLDRKALGELIFRDDQARRRLERIVHGPMLEELERRIEKAERGGAKVVVIEAAVLYQMGADKLVDKVVLVTAEREIRLGRLMRRDGLTREEAERRMRLHERLGIDKAPADWVIDTSGGMEDTRRQVEEIWREISGGE